MRSKILYTVGSIAALLVVLTIFFSIRPEGFLRRNEAAVTKAEIEAAGAAVTFTGKKAGADIPRVTGAEDFMAQYPFEQFTVEPVNAVPTGVYELARWRSSTAVVGHRTRNYSQATTSALWAMTGYNEYYIIEFPDGPHALALFDRGLAADLAKGKAVTLPISARAGVNTYAKPYLQDICAEYGADLENVVYAFDDGWYKEHSGQILLIRLGVVAVIIVAVAVLWALGDGLLKRKTKKHGEEDIAPMSRKKAITLEDYRSEVQIRKDGLLNIYPADSSILPDWNKFLDRHWEDESICWTPPFLECIFQDQEAIVRNIKQDGESKGAIPLSPILTEAIRIVTGRLPSIPDDLFQMKNLVVEPRGRHSVSDHYRNFTLWQGRYVFTRDIHFLTSRFYCSPGDWSAVGRMKKLKTLTIKYLDIHDFSFLANLESLQRLDLSGTPFSQDAVLSRLKNLQQLNLSGTGFSDCSILLQLPKLKKVNLMNCNLQNEDVLQQLTADILK